jgi:hypothetical protein
MSSTPSDPAAHRERLLPAVLIGIGAGLLGSLVLVWLSPSGMLVTATIYAVALLLAALLAVQFAPSNILEVWGLLFLGVAIGVVLSVLVHPTLGRGERNLWPFEVGAFWLVGLIPAWIGLFVGRRLKGRLSGLSPSNNRWRGP